MPAGRIVLEESMFFVSQKPLEVYVAPEVDLYELCAERSLLTVSGKQTENVEGKDDPDLIW